MNHSRFLSFLLVLGCILGPARGAAAAEVDCDAVYCFSSGDFGEEITGICITGLPDTGAVLLDSRVLQAGDILTAEQIGQMTFAPVRTEADASARIFYLPVFSGHVGEAAEMTIGIRGKVDQPPAAEDSAAETYKNLPVTGKLKVTDPEGQPMTYTVTRQPKRGTVTVDSDGSFTYTPKKNKIGVDSFVYTAADPAGKVSREATVTITILKPSDSTQYTDTIGRECRFAAEWMRHTGIFVGETLAETPCFSPDRQVTRGEFVTMLVKALDIPAEEELTVSYTDEVPLWLQPYLAAAVRSGLTDGLPDQQAFGADGIITEGEADILLCNALDAFDGEAFPVSGEAPLTRDTAARILYRAAKLAQETGKTELA